MRVVDREEFCPSLPGEDWRPVVGFEDLYDVSSLGRVCRIDGRTARGPMHTTPSKDGYLTLGLCRDGRKANYKVHTLTALAFLGPRPTGSVINHLDGVKTNNVAANLEYVSPSENIRHAVGLGRVRRKGPGKCSRCGSSAHNAQTCARREAGIWIRQTGRLCNLRDDEFALAFSQATAGELL